MTAANNPTRVVAIGEPGPTQDQIATALSTSAQIDFELVDVIVYLQNSIIAINQMLNYCNFRVDFEVC